MNKPIAWRALAGKDQIWYIRDERIRTISHEGSLKFLLTKCYRWKHLRGIGKQVPEPVHSPLLVIRAAEQTDGDSAANDACRVIYPKVSVSNTTLKQTWKTYRRCSRAARTWCSRARTEGTVRLAAAGTARRKRSSFTIH